jgi:hypothetical protein
MFKADGCYVVCRPLPTGADALCLAEYLKAPFACVRWTGSGSDKEHNLEEGVYQLGLLYFDTAAEKDAARTMLIAGFPEVISEGLRVGDFDWYKGDWFWSNNREE